MDSEAPNCSKSNTWPGNLPTRPRSTPPAFRWVAAACCSSLTRLRDGASVSNSKATLVRRKRCHSLLIACKSLVRSSSIDNLSFIPVPASASFSFTFLPAARLVVESTGTTCKTHVLLNGVLHDSHPFLAHLGHTWGRTPEPACWYPHQCDLFVATFPTCTHTNRQS